MSGDAHGAGSSSGDDLFDLPSDASQAQHVGPSPSSAAGSDLDLIGSALPKRQLSTGAAGPPLSNVESSAGGILDQVRKRPATAAAPVAAPAPVAQPEKRRFPRPTGPWIAFGAFGLVNALVLGFVVLRGSGSPEPEHADTTAPATVASVLPLGEGTGPAHAARPDAAHDSAQGADHGAVPSTAHAEPRPDSKHETAAPRDIPALFDASALDLARKSLKDAREDVAAGRRGAARARLGRIGLSIDAIQPAQREDIRAEVALLLAQTIQADADEAARSK
jgi:hypothetical protein